MRHNILLLPIIILSLVTACAPARASTGEAGAVQALGASAEARVKEILEGPVLRQVDTDLTRYTFYFADAQRSTVLTVSTSDVNSADPVWDVRQNDDPRLMNSPYPGIDLSLLEVGPRSTAEGLQERWPGCELRSMTLHYDSAAEELVWTGFCLVAGGMVSGSTTNRSGRFIPREGSPALLPPTAMPR